MKIFLFFLTLFCFPAFAEKRVALVIGNSAYKSTTSLPNTKNDAEDITAKLTSLGFLVIGGSDLDKRGIDEKLALFGRAIQDADVALFYYAGHGVQHNNQNYLMPVDAKLQDEFSLRFEMTRMDDVMNVIGSSKSGVKIVVLDACRNNPLADKMSPVNATRSVATRGLAPIEKTTGMVIAYATQSNNVALDGEGRNSPFTAAFLNHLNEDNLEIGTFFRKVAGEVNRKTKGAQTPELSVSMLGEFYFKRAETDVQAWTAMKGSVNESDYQKFMTRFPNSPLLEAAQTRLMLIEREKSETKFKSEQAAKIAHEQEESKRKALEEAENARSTREASLKAELEKIAKEREEASNSLAKAATPVVAGLAGAAMPLIVAPKAADPVAPPVIIASLPPPQTIAPPPADKPDGKQNIAIKTELKRIGCYFGKLDDRFETPQVLSALSAYARLAKLDIVPLTPSKELLDKLTSQKLRVCPLVCQVTELAQGDKCVAKTCPRGKELDDDGICYVKVVTKPVVKKEKSVSGYYKWLDQTTKIPASPSVVNSCVSKFKGQANARNDIQFCINAS